MKFKRLGLELCRLEKSLGRSCLCTNSERVLKGWILCLVVPRARGNRYKLKQEIPFKDSISAVAKHCHCLLRKVESMSLKRVKTHLDTGLSNLLMLTLLGVGIVGPDVL